MNLADIQVEVKDNIFFKESRLKLAFSCLDDFLMFNKINTYHKCKLLYEKIDTFDQVFCNTYRVKSLDNMIYYDNSLINISNTDFYIELMFQCNLQKLQLLGLI